MAFNPDAYLARIGWKGPREAGYGTLAGLLRAHMTAIPFENLDVLLGRPIGLDLDSVHTKLVDSKRGGYCFEHGTLFQAALEGLGFEPVAHAARVIMQRPRSEAPLTHMFLTVRMNGDTFVLDPGFGGHAPLVPVPLEVGRRVEEGTNLHQMVRRDGEWVLEARIDGAMVGLWSSSLEATPSIDFVVANHFVSTFPTSPFLNNMMLRAFSRCGRVSMLNRDLTIRRESGEVEKRLVADRAELRALLAEHFGFDLQNAETLQVPSVPEWG